MSTPPEQPQSRRRPLALKIAKISWRDLALTLGPVVLLSIVVIVVAIHFIRPAPPTSITFTSGPVGSSYYAIAQRYQAILERNGIHVNILASEGSLDNLKRLTADNGHAEIGLVQGGIATEADIHHLVSLGSLFYEPLTVVYRGRHAVHRLSEFKGKRIAVGPEGSGTRFLALALLKANGVPSTVPATLVALSGQETVDALLKRKIDVAFLMGDSASSATIRQLLHVRDIRIFDFSQADAYVRRFRYLSKLEIPAGSLDLGENLPPKPLMRLAPTVELVARDDLHPALSDLLIEAAKEIHGHASLLQNAGEFPAPLEHEYAISDDATRYYKSGKSFAYRYLPFWMASLMDRLLVVVVPVVILLVPAFKVVPSLYGWRIRNRIYRRYGELMALERAALSPATPAERAQQLERLDDIERSTIVSKAPGSFADEVYLLRQHINFVRDRLMGKNPVPTNFPPAPQAS